MVEINIYIVFLSNCESVLQPTPNMDLHGTDFYG